MKLILLSLTVLFLASCGTSRTYRCYPSKGSKDWAALKEGTITDSLFVKAKLLNVKRTMMGYYHSFVTANNDTVKEYINCKCNVDSMYWVSKGI